MPCQFHSSLTSSLQSCFVAQEDGGAVASTKQLNETKKKGVLKSMFDLTHFGLSRLFTRRILLINAVDGVRKQKKAGDFVVLLCPERRQNSSETGPKPVKVCFCRAETKDFLHLTVVYQFSDAFLQLSFKKHHYSHCTFPSCAAHIIPSLFLENVQTSP